MNTFTRNSTRVPGASALNLSDFLPALPLLSPVNPFAWDGWPEEERDPSSPGQHHGAIS